MILTGYGAFKRRFTHSFKTKSLSLGRGQGEGKKKLGIEK